MTHMLQWRFFSFRIRFLIADGIKILKYNCCNDASVAMTPICNDACVAMAQVLHCPKCCIGACVALAQNCNTASVAMTRFSLKIKIWKPKSCKIGAAITQEFQWRQFFVTHVLQWRNCCNGANVASTHVLHWRKCCNGALAHVVGKKVSCNRWPPPFCSWSMIIFSPISTC